MALVRSLQPDGRSVRKTHPTEVDARWQVISGGDGAVLFQLSTYGSDDRESEPKVSQTIQLNREIAAQLDAHLRETFDL
jgi:hypothetical protein